MGESIRAGTRCGAAHRASWVPYGVYHTVCGRGAFRCGAGTPGVRGVGVLTWAEYRSQIALRKPVAKLPEHCSLALRYPVAPGGYSAGACSSPA